MKSILLLLLMASWSEAQTRILSGLVLDASTNTPLPSATIRVAGTSKGTVTNAEGQFRLSLPAGAVFVAASYIGYASDTIRVELDADRFIAVLLQPNGIELTGVTVTDEDPANEIIRRAIDEKKRWMAQLRTFEGKAFNRLQIRTDSSIAAITEAYSTLYWTNGDSLREVITQQQQTGNLPSAFQASRVGNVLNFNDNTITLNGYTFIGPTAPDAFEHYEYRLRATKKMDDFDVYEIELLPTSTITPLFKGKIAIAERSYAVISVDVRPNEAMTQLFVDQRDSRYTQTFRLFDNKFWLPANYRFDGSFSISIMGISFPTFGIERDVVIYDYRINPEFADTIQRMNRLTIDSASVRYDSSFWAANDVLPLTAEQDSAYRTLDSTQTLEKKFAPKGAGAALISMSDSWWSVFDVWYNRVEGWHLGISRTFPDVVEKIDLRGGVGYGFADRRWKGEAGATLRFGAERGGLPAGAGFGSAPRPRTMFSLSIDLYDKNIYFPEPVLPGLLLNSFGAFFFKDDVQDYYRAIGGTLALQYVLDARTRWTVSAVSEQQRTLRQTTNHALFAKDKLFPYQPGINDGRMNAIRLGVQHVSSGLFGLQKEGYLLSGTIEHSAPLLGGGFDFTAAKGSIRAKFATAKKEELVFPPTMNVQIAGGAAGGALPSQRYFELYSKFEVFSGFGVMKGLQRREFYGDRYIHFTVDHNFRRMLFAPLGISRVMESSIDLVIEANAARSWFSGDELRSPLFPAADSRGWYYEGSIGLSNVLDVFRIDLTRRLSSPAGWAVTLSASDFLMSLVTAP